jgi:hypothetical protein
MMKWRTAFNERRGEDEKYKFMQHEQQFSGSGLECLDQNRVEDLVSALALHYS